MQLRAVFVIIVGIFVASCNGVQRNDGSSRIVQSMPATAIPMVTPAAPPSMAHCWILRKLFPVTRADFRRESLSAPEQREVEKWAKTAAFAQRQNVRWIRNPYKSGPSVLIFIADPLFSHGGYSPWDALNSNMVIDPKECRIHAYSKV